VNERWGEEGFGAENDWGEGSLEADAGEDALLDPVEVDDELDDDLPEDASDDDEEQ
jgi:hypothetical protein